MRSPSSPAARDLARLTLAAVAAVALLACGESAPTEPDVLGGATLRRLPLWPQPGAAARPALELVARIVPPDDPSSWTIDADEHAVEVHGDRSVLRLDGGAEQRVSIPIAQRSRAFNQVAVTVRTLVKRDVEVFLGVPGKPLAVGAPKRHLDGSFEERTLIFDFDENFRVRRDYDRITVVMSGWKGGWALHGVDLLQRARASWLPPHDAPAPVAVGEEARQAVALASEGPLQTELPVPPGGVLDFAVGVPRTLVLARGEEVPTVRFELHDGPVLAESTELALEPGEDGAVAWRGHRVDVGRFAGRTLRATFALDARAEAVCALSVPHVYGRGSGEPPVVLLVTSDTHRADHVGAVGGDVHTPALDALAAEGVLFTDCLASTNVTNPSHIALMTARHPRDTGILDNFRAVADGAPTLAEQFRDRGFTTLAVVSAQHLSHAESGLGQGFDRLSAPLVPQRDSVESIADLLAWLPELDGRPLFVWLHVFDAHTPYDPPAPFDRLYRPEGARDPFAGGVAESPAPEGFPAAFLEATVGRPGLRDLEFPNSQYRGEISYLDERLATVLGHARFRNAVVAVTGDHGESLGEHGVYWDHAGLHPQTLRVPLILRWPGGPRGVRSDAPVRLIDVPRTLLDVAGLGRVEFPGRDLRDVLPDAPGEKDARARPRFALAAHRLSASITEGRWHLVLHLRNHFPQSTRVEDVKTLVTAHSVELYDLEKDPECARDLRKRVKVAKPLRAKLVAWLKAREDLGWRGAELQDAERMRELAQLGYASPGGDDEVELFDFECACEFCRLYR